MQELLSMAVTKSGAMSYSKMYARSHGASHFKAHTLTRASAISSRPLLDKKIVDGLSNTGYAHIPSTYYLRNVSPLQISKVRVTFNHLEKDPNIGNRYRAYTRFVWDSTRNTLVQDENNDYYQTKESNYADGGKIRKFQKIHQLFLDSPIIKGLLKSNIEIAKQFDQVNFTSNLEVGLHQIRYCAKPHEPSFSSPVWLHKDDEPLVFVHLFNISSNLLGGENLVSDKGNKVNDVIKLMKPLETLAVSKRGLHAVTPMGTSDKKPSYRDILLITFFNRTTPISRAQGVQTKEIFDNKKPLGISISDDVNIQLDRPSVDSVRSVKAM